jgi:enamine deaminase RidA (YjgF/YER057c/UK114 family)
MSIQRIDAGPRMSMAVVHGNTVYLAGVVPDDGTLDTAGQTKQVLAKIDALLAKAGTDKSKLLSAVIYITDMKNFPDMNKVWDGWVSPGNTPARATVEAQLAQPAFKVEIMVVAGK